MPTSTFFHLPPEKQRKLLRSAVREFSQQPYGEVPLSRIIAGAEIPRGSFYQYFADKTDLFVYVLSHYGHQLKQLARDLEISVEVIRDVCADEIAEYIKLDAERDASLPVHSIVECYTGGTAFAWYGMNPYPRLKRVVLGKLAAGGKKAEKAFVLRASKAQVDYMGDY